MNRLNGMAGWVGVVASSGSEELTGWQLRPASPPPSSKSSMQKKRLEPGEGLLPSLYEQVARAIYQSHGNSMIGAMLRSKLDNCHTAFQLQKYLIKYGGQFSKLAMLGVRLEMMTIANTEPEPEPEQSTLAKTFISKFDETKNNFVARVEIERTKAAARKLKQEQEWAAVFSKLDAEIAEHGEEGNPRRRTKSPKKSPQKMRKKTASLIAFVSQDGENQSLAVQGKGGSPAATATPAKPRRTQSPPKSPRTLGYPSVSCAAEARIRIEKCGLYTEEWYDLKDRMNELDSEPYWRLNRRMSPERQVTRDRPLQSPRPQSARPATEETKLFRSKPMPPTPKGASPGLPGWMKTAIQVQFAAQVAMGVQPRRETVSSGAAAAAAAAALRGEGARPPSSFTATVPMSPKRPTTAPPRSTRGRPSTAGSGRRPPRPGSSVGQREAGWSEAGWNGPSPSGAQTARPQTASPRGRPATSPMLRRAFSPSLNRSAQTRPKDDPIKSVGISGGISGEPGLGLILGGRGAA